VRRVWMRGSMETRGNIYLRKGYTKLSQINSIKNVLLLEECAKVSNILNNEWMRVISDVSQDLGKI